MIAALLALAAMQCPDGTPPPCGRAGLRAPVANSVAVLYFDNVSRDTADAYLADGLTDEIILRLQQVRRLEVKSRYESERVRGRRNAAPAVLGRELNARYLVNGSIQRAAERLVVRVELTRADRGVGVWSERYDRTAANVLDVIDDVARGVATGVAGQLLPDEAADLSRRPSADPLAYEHFVRGNFYLAQRSATGLLHAVQEYELAWQRDSTLLRAPARVAYAYAIGASYGVGDLSPDSIMVLASRSVDRALRLAPRLSDAWLARGFLRAVHSLRGSGDSMSDAVADLARAVELDPQSAEAHHQYAWGLAFTGRGSAAYGEYRRALELEPGRAVTYQEIAALYEGQGRFPQAIAWSDSAISADPGLVRGPLVRARARLALGDLDGAGADVARVTPTAVGGNADEVHEVEAMILAARGDTVAARAELARASGRLDLFLTEALVATGQPEQALAAIRAISSRTLRCVVLRLPAIAPLRGRADGADLFGMSCPAPEIAP